MSRSPSPSRSTATARWTPGRSRERVIDERIAARVLQPLDAVIRLDDPVVERVAVRQEHVEIAVAVHVHQLDARRAPVRMRRRVDHLLIEREVVRAVVDVGDDRLVLLREQRDEIHLAVLVQIDRDRRGCCRGADRSRG